MNITFLIGNGFDLRMGMNTRFTDMYEGYIKQDSASDAIKKFKEMLEADAPKYKTWGDFEMAMAEKAKDFDDEESFIECLRDFKLYMVSHLIEEEKRFNERISASEDTSHKCSSEVKVSIEKFYSGLIPNVVNTFNNLGIRINPKYKAISFNYTTAFDRLLPTMGDVIHIHGTLGADIVLGVDNIEQVENLPYKKSNKFNRAFIKPQFNLMYDNERMKKAEQIIDKSDLICIYGMSLGDSDLSWRNRITDWLLADKNHHLVYFVHDDKQFDKSNWDAIIDEEENRIQRLIGRICRSTDEEDRIFEQLHIPVAYNIFDVDAIIKSEQRRVADENRRIEEMRKRLDEEKVRFVGA